MVVSDTTNQENTLVAYSKIAPVYQEYSQKYSKYLNTINSLVAQNLREGMRLLDVGAGDGKRLAFMKDQVALAECVAIEPSQGMAVLCEKTAQVKVHQVTAEKIDTLNIGSFDVVTALWNVLGHVPSPDSRLRALKNMANALTPDGIVMLDVNNRHNAASYGQRNVLLRRLLDYIAFNPARGDATFQWKIGDQSYPASGHLFTPQEMDHLIADAGLCRKLRYAINYSTGERSESPFQGQLFYVLTKRRSA